METMLTFTPVTFDDILQFKKFLPLQTYRTCDFSLGGILMWASYFRYEYAILKDTLFMKGVSEIDSSELAFSLPLGALSFEESIGILRDYCRQEDRKLLLSAVPEGALQALGSKFSYSLYQLQDWTDYLYDAQLLADLSGSLYHKKRNHVSKFRRLYPECVCLQIDQSNIDEVISFFYFYKQKCEKLGPIFQNEMETTELVLKNYLNSGFIGVMLKIGQQVIGFTIGEVIRDTLYVHIEKADREYSGVYETLNMSFVVNVLEHHPEVKYVNREEDVGDEGLRKAKLSYHPVCLLNKYNLEFSY